jgi:hypothetical protein
MPGHQGDVSKRERADACREAVEEGLYGPAAGRRSNIRTSSTGLTIAKRL